MSLYRICTLLTDDGMLYFDKIIRGGYSNLKLEIRSVFKWLQANKLVLNNGKTKMLIFDTNTNLDAVWVNVMNGLTLIICECTGWPKSCDTNVAAYCDLINNAMNLILADMCSFIQPFEDLNKSK